MKNEKRAARNGRKKRANGRAPDDLAELFAGLYADPDPADAPGDGSGKAEVLAEVADNSIFEAGAGGLKRLAEAIGRGWLDDPAEVTDATRRQIIDHVGRRLESGTPAEKVAAAAAFDAIVSRPGARPEPAAACAAGSLGRGPPGAEPSASGAGGAEPAPGGGGPAGPSATASNGGRTRRGTFARGNKCAKGNPFARKMALFRSSLLRGLDEGKLEALGDKLYSLALAGDVTAAELLLKYAVGKPTPAVNPDRLDSDEFAVLTSGPTLSALWHAAHEVADPAFAVEIWKRLSASGPDAATTQLVNAVEAEPGRFAKDLAAERKAKVGR
jgi:hypothetical protein